VKHYAAPDFWSCYKRLPDDIQQTANKSFALLKQDPRHPSLQLKKLDWVWSARVGLYYRALAVDVPGGPMVLDWDSRGIRPDGRLVQTDASPAGINRLPGQ
jgi:hypothetical protein